MAKIDWFTESRFGMFIHWGLYAIPARGEWVRSHERISNEDYQKYFDAFDPTDYDPKLWARAAKNAGMKYAVMTAKHHDGFCLFDSKLTDYKAANTKAGRDLLREYADAFRAEGLKVGFYYSLIDWRHPDYPHYGDSHHPMRENEAFKGANHDFDNYVKYLHGQVEELCQNYGKIDLFWFDFSYGEMSGEKWKATELVRMIRGYFPDVLIDNRLESSAEGESSLRTGSPSEYAGDFANPEQIIPQKGVANDAGEPIPWEACITMNNNWGFCQADKSFKPAGMIIKKLAECVSKGGNLLLNVGPDARGRIPEESIEILEKVGVWMKRNGESIYGCGGAGMDKPEYGRMTRKGNVIYYHVMESPVGLLPLAGLSRGQIKRVWLVSTGAEMPIAGDWVASSYPGTVFVSFGGNPVLPDRDDAVIGVELAD